MSIIQTDLEKKSPDVKVVNGNFKVRRPLFSFCFSFVLCLLACVSFVLFLGPTAVTFCLFGGDGEWRRVPKGRRGGGIVSARTV